MRIYILLMICIFIPQAAMAIPCNATLGITSVIYKDGPAFSGKTFVDDFLSAMQGEAFKGYALQVTDGDGEEVARIEKGIARTACDADGEQAFTVDTNTGWASVSKVITTAAVLHALENSPYGYTIDHKLVHFLPFQWRPELHERLQDVTLKDLLQHKAGFRTDGCPGHNWREILREGGLFPECDAPPAVGEREYSNRSMAIFSYILAYIANPGGMFQVETSPLAAFDYDSFIFGFTSEYYEDYVQNNLFSPIGVTASCLRPSYSGLGSNYTLGFLEQSTTIGEMPAYQMQWCPSGGWVMSTRGLTSFVSTLQNSNTILSRESYDTMTSIGNYLGWSQTSRDSIPTIPSHGGAYLRVRSGIAALSNGFTATWVGNTPWRNGLPGFAEGDPDATTFLLDAFHRARVSAIAQMMNPIIKVVE